MRDDFEDDYISNIYDDMNPEEKLNDSDAKKLPEIESNKKNDHNNNSNNGNNNVFIIKKLESNIERQTLENKKTYTTNKKETNNQSKDSQEFSGSYQEYLDSEGLSGNISQKSTNNSEKKEPLIEHNSIKIISVKRSNSYFHPNQKENLLFPEDKNEKKYFDLGPIIEIEKKVKEYDKKVFKILSETEDCKYIDRNSLFLDDVNHKCKKTESKNDEKDNNFIKCLYIGSESDVSYKKSPDLLVKKTCRKRK